MFYRHPSNFHSGPVTFGRSNGRSGSIRLWLLVVGAIFLVMILAGAILMALTVDDWNRDLSTNQAATSPDHPDAQMRCLILPLEIDDAAALVRRRASGLSGWSIAPTSSPNHVIRLERTTRWLRFVDDITVTLTTVDGGTRVSITSRSRIGKGDLGQNPRNIRELLRAVQSES